MSQRRMVTKALAVAALALAALLAWTPTAGAECVYTKSIVQVHKTGQVRGTFKGTFEPGDFLFEPGGEVVIQIGVASQTIPVESFKGNDKRRKYTHKGSWDDVVKKAVFDLKRGKVLVKCRSTEGTDYQPPMHAAVGANNRFVFEIPVIPEKKKSKIKQRLVGAVGGAPLAAGVAGPGGTEVVAPGVIVTAGPGALLDDIDIDIVTGVLPAGLPPGALQAGPVFIIDLNGADAALDGPLTLEFSYDVSNLGPDDVVTVLHFNDETGMYEPTTVTDIGAGTITVQCRSFSSFVPAILLASAIPDSYSVPGFAPPTHGWSIPNFGAYLAPNGNCLGMAAYCSWFFSAKPSETLSTKYTGDDARIVATRAHLAQSTYWAAQQFDFQQALGEPLTARVMRAYLAFFGEPAVMVMLSPDSGNAAVCYGYDAAGFRFYDVDVVGQEQLLPYSLAGGFGTYGAYDRFAVLALPTLGRTGDFEGLYQDAENGFRSGDVTITAPQEGILLTTRTTMVTGTVTEPAWDGASVFVNGQRFDTQIENGEFEIAVPLVDGDNPITVLAGTNRSPQSSFAPGSGVAHIDVEAALAAADLLVTMRWLQDGTDMDLYLHEPDGQVCWYSNDLTENGTQLDIDDTDGFGPEHITVGTGQTGTYTVRAHYYSGGVTATGTIDIRLDEGLPTERLETFPFSIATSNSSNDTPGSVGPDWVDIADIDLTTGVITPR